MLHSKYEIIDTNIYAQNEFQAIISLLNILFSSKGYLWLRVSECFYPTCDDSTNREMLSHSVDGVGLTPGMRQRIITKCKPLQNIFKKHMI